MIYLVKFFIERILSFIEKETIIYNYWETIVIKSWPVVLPDWVNDVACHILESFDTYIVSQAKTNPLYFFPQKCHRIV